MDIAGLFDTAGNCAAIVGKSGTVWAIACDESYFYGNTPETESETQGGNSGEGGQGGGTETPKDGKSWTIVIVVAAIAAAAVGAGIILQRKKKNAAGNGGGTVVGASGVPMEQQMYIPQPMYTPQPEPKVYSAEDYGSTVPVSQAPGAAVSSAVSLTGVGGCMSGRIYQVSGSEILIGRDPSCTIQYPADARGVSRRHCKVFWKNGTLMLMDCGSSYGTYLEGKGRLQAQWPVAVKDGDVFYVGEKNNGFRIR